jgi:hypothetical protein
LKAFAAGTKVDSPAERPLNRCSPVNGGADPAKSKICTNSVSYIGQNLETEGKG